MNTYIYIIIAYFIGSIPFGLILSYMAGLGDIRKIGSGNIGATNALRTGNKFIAVATLLLDIGKGALAVCFIKTGVINPNNIITLDILPFATATAVILGHIFPLWLKFKGGKGVATFLGVLLALNWAIGLVFIGSWIMIFLAIKISSVAAMTAIIIVAVIGYFFAGQMFGIFASVIGMLIVIKHNENIERLIKGEEN